MIHQHGKSKRRDTMFESLDAIYEKVRLDGRVRDAAVLIASGVNLEGKRLILGVSVSVGEQELHWRDFLQSLVERGLNGVELISAMATWGCRQPAERFSAASRGSDVNFACSRTPASMCLARA